MLTTGTTTTSWSGEGENSDDTRKTDPTPLPIRQMGILMFLRFAEAASVFSFLPFLDELLTGIAHGDEAKVGYYAGTMESIRQLTSFAVVMYWSRLSDHVGRKPVLLLGTFALSVSMFSFGMSKTFLGLVLSRCIFSALNSNAGVIKGTIGEITDTTNSASAFALLHVPWSIGSSFGAFIGGWLARPSERFPSLFSGTLWKEYPYFLPCFIMSVISFVACIIVCFYLNESVPGTRLYKSKSKVDDTPEDRPLLSTSEDSEGLLTQGPNLQDVSKPAPLRSLLTWKVLLPVSNYVSIACLHAAFNVVQPLFLAMPVHLGGLAFPTHLIGVIMAVYGVINSIVQTFLLGRLVRRFGVKAVYMSAVGALIPIFALSPAMNLCAKVGMGGAVWMLLVCQLSCLLVVELGYGCIYMYITAAAPNKRSLGATNGLAQMLAPVGRILGPLISTNLLSFSIQHQLLWGYASYFVLVLMGFGGLRLASELPSRLD